VYLIISVLHALPFGLFIYRRNYTGNSLTIWKPSPECFPNHVSVNETVTLHFQESATTLSVTPAALAEESILTVS
jgi:hypothetical protein